jgi:hypothetical protein
VPVVSARPWALRAAAAAGVAVTLWVGASLSGGMRPERVEPPTVGVVDASRAVVTVAAGRAQAPEVGETESVALPEPAESGAPSEAAVEADSTAWQPAVARTWVNVRREASPDGEVVGVISPDSRAMLGTTRRGWRRIALDDVTGWVDPRLFSSASAGG